MRSLTVGWLVSWLASGVGGGLGESGGSGWCSLVKSKLGGGNVGCRKRGGRGGQGRGERVGGKKEGRKEGKPWGICTQQRKRLKK